MKNKRVKSMATKGLSSCSTTIANRTLTQSYGLPVIGRCNYRPVITAVITVITTALFQLPVIGQDKPSVRVPSPADTRAAARQSHLQGHVTEEMALTAPR